MSWLLDEEDKLKAHEEPPRWLIYVARIGYGARATVFVTSGILAFLAVFKGEKFNPRGALHADFSIPGGPVLLIALAVGLGAFSLWRAFQTIFDPDRRKMDLTGMLRRFGFLISGSTYVGLVVACLHILWSGGRGGGSNAATQSWTAWALKLWNGRWLVGLAGCVMVGIGIGFIVTAWTRPLKHRLNLPETWMQHLLFICRFGIAARGVVFVLIGSFLLYAAYTVDSSKAGALRQVFHNVSIQPYGTAMLSILAAGLLAYGGYGIIQAIWRQVGTAKAS